MSAHTIENMSDVANSAARIAALSIAAQAIMEGGALPEAERENCAVYLLGTINLLAEDLRDRADRLSFEAERAEPSP